MIRPRPEMYAKDAREAYHASRDLEAKCTPPYFFRELPHEKVPSIKDFNFRIPEHIQDYSSLKLPTRIFSHESSPVIIVGGSGSLEEFRDLAHMLALYTIRHRIPVIIAIDNRGPQTYLNPKSA
jgi:hypothetical protein